MSSKTDTNQLGWPRWQQLLLIAVLVLFIGSRLTSLVDAAAHRAGLFGEGALIELSWVNDQNAPAGFRKVDGVEPNSSFARAGVRIGDHVRLDSRFRDGRLIARGERPYRQDWLFAGDRINFTLDRGGVRSEFHVILQPLSADPEQEYGNNLRLVNVLATLISSLVGCFVLWRGWGNTTAMLLGVALTFIGRGWTTIPPWASNLVLEITLWWLLYISFSFVALLIPFAIRMLEQQGRALPRWHWRLATAWFIWSLVSFSALAADHLAATNFITITTAWRTGYISLVQLISLLVAIAYLVAGWRWARAAERSRFVLIIFALAAYLVPAVPLLIELARTGARNAVSGNAPLILNALMLGIVAPGLLAYAVLRHKLFDLGFAINRTLVFGAVGLLLLVSFALIEWAIKQAIPKVWYGGSVYISALIAVGLYLTFNRLHHKVEHAIERVFFHKWQVNEAALKRFVAAAAHVEKPEALAGNFVAELARFSGGAEVAIYARSAKGAYASAQGKPIDPDDPALAAMRAEQGPVVPAELGSPLDAALALPMMHQAALAGFVLLGPKPTGEDYRPDEVDVLSWATQQVGLDLQAIRVRELELSLIKLEARNANLADVLAKAALPQT